jgi:hypothetical protein
LAASSFYDAQQAIAMPHGKKGPAPLNLLGILIFHGVFMIFGLQLPVL